MPPPEINLTLDVLALAPKTRREYKNALLQFFEYCSRFNYTAHTAEELDTVLFDYIHFEFHSPGRDGRQHVNKFMAVIKHLVPEVRNALPISQKMPNRLRSSMSQPAYHTLSKRSCSFHRSHFSQQRTIRPFPRCPTLFR